VILEAVAALAAAYQVFAVIACLKRGRGPGARGQQASISVLKPVRGVDDGLREALASHAGLKAEVLCGVPNMDDPAVAVIREFPFIRLVVCPTRTANAKVGVLADLAAASLGSILVVSDADIRVEPDYLERVTGPLADPKVGMMTCLYRPVGDTFAGQFEGLGVSTDFAPSVLVARLVGVDEFAMGSTMAFRRADLERIGGFASIADYVADDYQLGHKIHALGLKCLVSDVIVETHFGGGFAEVWRHQLRWARTIRVSKFFGYLGLPVTFATLWAVVAAVCGRYEIAGALLAVRMIAAIEAGWFVIRSRDVLRLFFLIPMRDLFGVAIWAAGLFGNKVWWRGRQLRLDRDGRIRPV
jgi:ceramide glucosyltransferase